MANESLTVPPGSGILARMSKRSPSIHDGPPVMRYDGSGPPGPYATAISDCNVKWVAVKAPAGVRFMLSDACSDWSRLIEATSNAGGFWSDVCDTWPETGRTSAARATHARAVKCIT